MQQVFETRLGKDGNKRVNCLCVVLRSLM